MYRGITYLLISGALFKASAQIYTMYAPEVIGKDDKVYANNSVIIKSGDLIYRAKRAIYDKKKELLELYEDVSITSNNTTTYSPHMKIDLKRQEAKTKKFFIYDCSSKLWVRGREFDLNRDIYEIEDSEVSSCEVYDPDWKILFSTGRYYQSKDFLTLTRPTFYFKNIPILALPWFAFPTVKKRTSGLLRPDIGVDSENGVTYIQPYFYAPKPNWDIEFRPQIRSKRGYGLYGDIRFVDSKSSSGSLSFGKFYEDGVYAKKNSIKNSTHYGAELKYQRSSLLSSLFKKDSTTDGFMLDLNYINDIDYQNLKSSTIKSYNKLVTSKLNYHIKRDRDYFGVYSKYFIDTSKDSNDDTMQELPTLHYHRFTTKTPIENLIYSIDYKYKRNYRKEGLNASLHEVNMPLKLDIPLLDNFLNFSVSENLYYNKIEYSNSTLESIDNAKYFSNYHQISLNSDLLKPYENFLHNIQLEARWIVPSFEDKDGYFADFISIGPQKKSLILGVNQYFYNNLGNNFLSLRSRQHIYGKDEDKKYGDFLNEVLFHYSKNLTIGENISYSHDDNILNKIQTSITYSDNSYNFRLSHTYKDDSYSSKINYVTSDLSMKLVNDFVVNANINYDLDQDITRDWSLGVFRDKRCWDYKVTYKESMIPIFTSGGSRSYKSRGIYFLVNFDSIGGVAYDYSKDSLDEG
jgi:LPS-assembly protein